MDNTRIIDKVISALLLKTEASEIEWRPAWGQGFVFEGETGTVVVESRDGDGVAPFQIRILDDGGVETDRYLDDDSSTLLPKLYHRISRKTVGGSPASPILTALARELQAV